MKRDGDAAEDRALAYLCARGCRLETRNYRCRFGEIDLIVWDGPTLAFVEVRKRSGARFGSAADSITAAKRDRLVAAARHYLASRDADVPCRFDAVLLEGRDDPRWVRDAFTA